MKRRTAALIPLWLGLSLAGQAQTPAPTPEERSSLVYMFEEEKLARDVYQQLHAKWRMRIFSNIARSESRHLQAVGHLMELYGVRDPVSDLPAGVYANPDLKALYHKLIEKGSVSLKDALEVGVIIEKQDIADLENAVKATSETAIKAVYNNLHAGSLNHLDAFEHTLEVLGAAQ